MKRKLTALILCFMMCVMTACGSSNQEQTSETTKATDNTAESSSKVEGMPEDFTLVKGGSFQMGSKNSEPWRGKDETRHKVTVSDFYMETHEVTQEEYESVMKDNPSSFSGEKLPVENLTWPEAVKYCNERSKAEGLTSAYKIDEDNVTWNRSADGYRLPTEAEWEYACRSKTTTPFNTETSISVDEANYWGDYPYEIEDNYFDQDNLETKPGIYRETTVDVGTFKANAYGLSEMHGNVGEWVWDYYGSYDTKKTNNPTGADSGTRRVYRGGGWNDFAKNLRSAYRAAMAPDQKSASVGIRLVRNVEKSKAKGNVASKENSKKKSGNGKMLIAYFSWGGNTKGIAEEIKSQVDADIIEIEMEEPYSSDYDTVLDQAQRDQKQQARPKLTTKVDNMDQYDTILLGYPNWWASIPMPIASFLESYDFSGKTIVPFCSHGGGRLGQSVTAISKLAPDATMGEGLAINYSGGGSLSDDISKWLDDNKIKKK